MNKFNVMDMIGIGPDLLRLPHILPELVELFTGERQEIPGQQQNLTEHLTNCHYCRIAVMALLEVVQEYERVNNDSQEVSYNLLLRFAQISREIDAQESYTFERQAAYSETYVFHGKDEAERRFKDVAEHLKICSGCRSIIDETIAIIESER